LAGLVSDGVVEVPIAQVFDLDHAADAHRAVESQHTRGKVVVRVRSGS
jgi:NADPH2:quinone reductase